MGRWSRQELEEAFAHYQAVAAEAGTSGDWSPWADLFTEDAIYVEHLYGRFSGREAIRRWITTTMAEPINDQMQFFPIEWYVIDEERGWVVFQAWNRMVDPGDGSVHQEANFTLVKYAGGNRWSYEEDIYNPADFATMVQGWLERRQELSPDT